MDANRYFEEMHKVMTVPQSAQKLLLCAKYQDAAGCDAYIELRFDAASRTARIFYSTMGRKYLNFQLFREGWKLCHNAAGEMTRRFPSSAEELIRQTDFHAFFRDEPFDAEKAARILRELELHAGARIECTSSDEKASRVTLDSYVGAGAHWSYSGEPDEACRPAAAILYWLADHLAGGERRALQANVQVAQLAARWEAEIEFAKTKPLSPARPQSRAHAAPPVRTRRPVQNERWQSILAVLSTV